MPVFLTAQQIYRIIQRELPADVYPDGPATGFYSTADSYATAQVIECAYDNLDDIYMNYFPNLATDRLPDFEFLYLGANLDASLTIDERRARVLSKIRTQRRTTPADILAVIYSIIDSSIPVEILEWNGNFNGTRYGAWILGLSTLGVDAFLGGVAPIRGARRDVPPIDCNLDYESVGLTAAQFEQMQETAFTYTVDIGATLDAGTLAAIDTALNAAEGASRRHVIVAPAGYLLEDSTGDYLTDDSGNRLLNG